MVSLAREVGGQLDLRAEGQKLFRSGQVAGMKAQVDARALRGVGEIITHNVQSGCIYCQIN